MQKTNKISSINLSEILSKTLSFLKLHWPLLIIWLLALFVRFYRQDQLLGFYYDQGRDALMARDIIKGINHPAIGPTTGIQGLYLGPFWYYLITPGYFFSKGNPATAAYFISFIESLSIPLLYFLIKKYFHQSSALLAIIFWSFSNYLVRSSRWFSNPSPIPTFALLIIYFTLEVFQNHRYYKLFIISLLLGLSLQLEAASAIFFIPSLLLFSLINYKTLKKTPPKHYLYSVIAFFATLLPQLAFEIKNNFPVTKTFFAFLSGSVNTTSGKSWGIPDLIFIQDRTKFYYQVFFTKLDTNLTPFSLILLSIFILGIINLLLQHRHKLFVQLSLIWLFIPLLILFFFQGNYGTLYDYYLTGFFPAFTILFSLSIFASKKLYLNLILALLAFAIFTKGNYIYLRDYLIAGVDGPTHISLGNQSQALKYVCQNSPQDYNLNVYVPPITPHTYNYLMDWYQDQEICHPPSHENQSRIFSLYEVDLNNPQNLDNWLKSQDTVGKIDSEINFGGIVVQQRVR